MSNMLCNLPSILRVYTWLDLICLFNIKCNHLSYLFRWGLCMQISVVYYSPHCTMAHIFGSFISEHSNANIISQFRRAIFTSSANVQMCNYVPCHRLTNSNIFLPKSPLNIQKRSFGGYLEEYYTTSNASTGFSTPLRSLFIYSLVVLQVIIYTIMLCFLLHLMI